MVEGLDPVEWKIRIIRVNFILSKSELDTSHLGYQNPKQIRKDLNEASRKVRDFHKRKLASIARGDSPRR